MLKNTKKVSFLFSVLFSFGLVIVPIGTEAVILYLEPSDGRYYQGDIFLVEVRIDTEQECINTVKTNLSFSKDILEVVDFSQGNSILTVWLKKPEISQESGLISFTGGIPGGYCGRIPGDPGKSNLLGRIVFKTQATSDKRQGLVKFLDDSQVLLNDGFGTPAKLTLKGATFTILPEKLEVPKKEWQEELEKDTIPPEPFEIEISQDPLIFDGRYFIIFQTQDKQTGIDFYQVKEGKRDWKKAESPYLLEDQNLQSIIKVRAVDKAGNERIAEYLPPKKITWRDILPWIILVLVIGGIIWLIAKLRKITRKTTPNL